MKRQSYSLYFVPSALHGRELQVKDQLTCMLIVWAETTPRVGSFELSTPSFVYDDDKGGCLETRVAMQLTMTSGDVAYWDACRSERREKLAKPLSIKAAHARLAGARHQVFSEDILEPSSIERRNRVAAQQMLFLGRRLDTEALETQLVLRLWDGPVRLNRFAAERSVPAEVATLAAIRSHLKGRAVVPLATAPVGEGWTVEGVAP